MSNEKELAEVVVLPELLKLGFDRNQISEYDKYPIHLGTSSLRVDYVCSLGMSDEPYLIVEVKSKSNDFDLYQVESYAQILGAPFFALTNGKEWKWYLTRIGQENSIRIDKLPIPESFKKTVYTKDNVIQNKILSEVQRKIEVVFDKEPDLLNGQIGWHNDALDIISQKMQEVPHMSRKQLAMFLTDRGFMNRKNNSLIGDQISQCDIKEIKKSLSLLIKEDLDIISTYDALVDTKSEYHISGLGPLVITRIISALYDGYFTLNTKVMKTISELGLMADRSPTRKLVGKEYQNLMDLFNPLKKTRVIEEKGAEFLHIIFWNWDLIEETYNEITES